MMNSQDFGPLAGERIALTMEENAGRYLLRMKVRAQPQTEQSKT